MHLPGGGGGCQGSLRMLSFVWCVDGEVLNKCCVACAVLVSQICSGAEGGRCAFAFPVVVCSLHWLTRVFDAFVLLMLIFLDHEGPDGDVFARLV